MKVPNYLWGEGVRHSTYLINRVATKVLKTSTPYEALKGCKPSIEHLKVFDYIGYTKSDIPQLKKLDDRTRVLVHLGTEPGSKAYRLYDPMNRRLVVSRDVVFDESKGWNWSNSARETSDEPGKFKILFGDFGNKGIREDEEAENAHDKEDEGDEQEDSVSPLSQDVTDEENQTQPELRRSTRITKTPSYLDDYVYLA